MNKNSEIFTLLNKVTKNVKTNSMNAIMTNASYKFGLKANSMMSKLKVKANVLEYHKKQTPLKREYALSILSEYPNGLCQKDLSEQLGINASSTSELVKRIEEDGYISKVYEENDKRKVSLVLTEIGRQKAEIINDEKLEVLDEVFSVLTEVDRDDLIRILKKLV